MPSYSPHASRPSTFRAPRWGAPALPSSCCRWRSTTSRGSAPFSHRSASRIFIRQPDCIPSPMVIQDDDHQFDGGEKQAGLRPLPRPQLQGSSLSLLGRRAGQVGACLRVSRGPLLPPVIGGEGHSPSVQLAAAACIAHRSERLWRCFRCHLPPLGRSAAARPPHGCQLRRVRAGHVQVLPTSSAAQHVVRREGGNRVLGRSRSRSRGENGSEDLPVRFGVAVARWCGVGGQVAAVIGVEVVAAREGFSADETVGTTCGWTSGSSALMACPRPSCGDVGEGLPTAAFALRSSLLLFSRPRRRLLSLLVQWSSASHLEFVVPQALWCGGCSYPQEWNRSSVCNGTLSVGVCSLWLSRPEHLGIWA
jgi:hypothetical protein